MTVSEEHLQSLFSQFQKCMVDNGDWDKQDSNPSHSKFCLNLSAMPSRILLTLTRELNEAGWIDEVKSQSKELAKHHNSPISFQALLEATTPIANEQLILFKKKALIEALIRKSLDAQIEG
jgi:hypothetical protein